MVSKEDLTKAKIFPIDVESHIKESLNMNYSEIELLGVKYGFGDILEAVDPRKFTMIVNEEIRQHLAEEVWIEIDGFYYSTYEVNCYLGIDE